ncbi:hypothetical protein ADU59_19555 [Pararhizobium polonicum]|uniref:Uncharacterized protein n=1 Tax=Pararhizobium polonicum TaxID=1612624 RepID=A0A1C7NY23_9HYPH|nr:hypothetical protein [Pararhizobium polonicum]OBZ93889.1 hypothetical protein ADU59_19555 [Pararhizobium polonicum]
MTSDPNFSEAQLKLWMRRVQTEMSKGTPPEYTLDLIKAAMEAQSAGELHLPDETEIQQNPQRNSRESR